MQKRDMKSGVVGAALSALAFVTVYEGKVAVSHASEHVDLAAGESAQANANGVARMSADEAAAAAARVAANDDPVAKANENLVGQVADYKSRLESIASQKRSLEEKLAQSEKRLAAAGDAGGSTRNRSEWELDKDDWKELAKEGSVKFRTPCTKEDWNFSPEKMTKLGLAPGDAPEVRDAYDRTTQKMWAQIKPLCAQALGTSPEIVEKIGLNTCPHLIYDVARATDSEAAAEAMTEVAEIRAGTRPEPAPGSKMNPVMQTFLVLTGAVDMLQTDLAKSFGPDEAHHLLYTDDSGICMGQHKWGGGKRR